MEKGQLLVHKQSTETAAAQVALPDFWSQPILLVAACGVFQQTFCAAHATKHDDETS